MASTWKIPTLHLIIIIESKDFNSTETWVGRLLQQAFTSRKGGLVILCECTNTQKAQFQWIVLIIHELMIFIMLLWLLMCVNMLSKKCRLIF